MGSVEFIFIFMVNCIMFLLHAVENLNRTISTVFYKRKPTRCKGVENDASRPPNLSLPRVTLTFDLLTPDLLVILHTFCGCVNSLSESGHSPLDLLQMVDVSFQVW